MMNGEIRSDDGARSRLLCVTLVLFVVAGGSACGNCGVPEMPEAERYEPVDEDFEPDPVCLDVEVQQSSAEPFDRVDVELEILAPDDGVLRPYEGPFGVDVDYDGDRELFLPVFYDGQTDGHYFYGPGHPAGLDGGEATLQFTDGDLFCDETLEFTVESIPAAPDALEELIDAGSDLTRSLVEEYGYDPDEFVEMEPDEIPAMLYPLKFQLWALDHPDNPDSLAASLESGDLPFDFDDEDVAVTGAYLKRAGLLEAIEASKAAVDAGQFSGDLDFSSPSTEIRDDVETAKQPLCSMFSDFMEVDIESAEQLSRYMKDAEIAAVRGERLEISSNLLSIVSLVPGGGGAAASVLGLFVTVYQLIQSAHANTYPRYLENPSVEEWRGVWYTDEDQVFYEDYVQYETWYGYNVDARAPGWDATAEVADALLDLATEVFRLKALPDTAIQRAVNRLEIPEEYVAEFVENITGFIADNVRSEGTEYILDGSGLCVFDPGPWEQVWILNEHNDETDEPWLDVRYMGSIDARARSESHHSEFCPSLDDVLPPSNPGEDPLLPDSTSDYEPVSTGEGRIHVNTNPEEFPQKDNNHSSAWDGYLDVSPIEVEIFDGNRKAELGDVVELRAEIRNCHDCGGDWEVVAGEADIIDEYVVDDDGTAEHVAELQMPDDDFDFTHVSLESTSEDGLRHPDCDNEPRSDSVFIQDTSFLHIDPQYRCVEEDGNVQFEAIESSADDRDVTWSSTGGSIDDDGLFHGDEEGEFIVTGELAGTDVADSARIRVGPCECFYNVSIQGGLNTSYGGFDINASSLDDHFMIEPGRGDFDKGGAITADFVPWQVPTVVPAAASLEFGEYRPAETGGINVWAEGVLAIHHWSGDEYDDYIHGSFSGHSLEAGFDTPATREEQEPQMVYVGPSLITVDFMSPVSRSPFGNVLGDCGLE